MPRSDEFTRNLLRLARDVLGAYKEVPELEAALVTGSVAQGRADAYSDLDLMLYLGEPPGADLVDTEMRRAEASGGGVYGGTPEEGFGVYRYVEGVKVDLGFNLVAKTDEIFDKVFEAHEVADLDAQLIIRGIRTGLPLYGEALIGRWLERSDTYPEGLQTAMIRAHERLTPRWVLDKMGADRDDPFFVYERVFGDQKKILSLLYALNRVYHPNKVKGLAALVAPLRIKPDDLIGRFGELYKLPVRKAVGALARLQDEMLALVERERPDLDMSGARRWLEMTLTRR